MNKPESQLAQKAPSALAIMASRCAVDPAKLLATLKETVFKGATDTELLALVVVANRYGLDPLTRQIYAFANKGGGIVPVVSCDGWFSMMHNHQRFGGLDVEFTDSPEGEPLSCTATIFLKDTDHPVRITEYFVECKRNSEPWEGMPRRMLRHKAITQAARVAFGFSGVFDEDEAADIMRGAQKPPRVTKFKRPKKDAPAKSETVEVETTRA